jgi:hypothetical protein
MNDAGFVLFDIVAAPLDVAHQSGTGGFTYFLEPVGKKDDMVLLDIDASSCARRAG